MSQVAFQFQQILGSCQDPSEERAQRLWRRAHELFELAKSPPDSSGWQPKLAFRRLVRFRLLESLAFLFGAESRELVRLSIADLRRDARDMLREGRSRAFVRLVCTWHALRCIVPIVIDGAWRAVKRVMPLVGRVSEWLGPRS